MDTKDPLEVTHIAHFWRSIEFYCTSKVFAKATCFRASRGRSTKAPISLEIKVQHVLSAEAVDDALLRWLAEDPTIETSTRDLELKIHGRSYETPPSAVLCESLMSLYELFSLTLQTVRGCPPNQERTTAGTLTSSCNHDLNERGSDRRTMPEDSISQPPGELSIRNGSELN